MERRVLLWRQEAGSKFQYRQSHQTEESFLKESKRDSWGLHLPRPHYSRLPTRPATGEVGYVRGHHAPEPACRTRPTRTCPSCFATPGRCATALLRWTAAGPMAGSTVDVVVFIGTQDRAGRVSQGWLTLHDEPSRRSDVLFPKFGAQGARSQGGSLGGGFCAQQEEDA